MTGQGFALDVTFDSVLNEWVGDEINNLGTQPAPEGGSYTLLAVWDGTEFIVAMDRDSSNRYLGDTGWADDSFFLAIDTDGIPYSGAALDGYQRMNFAGPMLPDVIYSFAGGPNWYESSTWNGTGWDWNGWTDSGAIYGTSESQPNDELFVDILNKSIHNLSGASELHIWAWMTREGNGWIEASWPGGYTGSQPTMAAAPLKVKDLATILAAPHDPSPGNYESDVLVEDPFVTFSWDVPMTPTAADPNVFEVQPNLAYHKLYRSSGSPTDPNVYFETDVYGWDGSLRASHTLSYALLTDAQYFWRVDKVLDNDNEVEGDVWTFYTVTLKITSGPESQVVPAGSTADFTVTVQSPTTPTATWYKVGQAEPLETGGKISISPDTLTLSITNVQIEEEGAYYCIVNNESGVPATSGQALLGVRRRIAYWPFEDNDANSVETGSPTSVLYGDPAFTTDGIDGDAIVFDADEDAQDLLYTNPEEASYFDICHYTMTAACWVKASIASTWGPLVARNGEGSQGWQLRHSGFTLDRVCFTTRGTGYDDGTPTNRTVYDGQWHWVVATYDGAEKKVYIDGVVSRLYSSDDGSVAQESDAVSGLIDPTGSPLSIAGRVKGNTESGLEIENYTVTAGTYDEIEIYNYALDAATVAQKYADLTETAVCAGIQAYDLDGDCMVNMDDLGLLASEWLNDELTQPTP